MERLTGVGAAPGIAIGKAHVLGSRVDVHERRIAKETIDAEMARSEQAIAQTDAQLADIQQEIAEREHDGHQYRILEAHRMMLQDVHLVEVARKIIRDEQTGAEWAVRRALDQIQAVFDRIEDPYFRDRRSDVAVVGERLLRNLLGMVETNPGEAPKGSIVLTHDLAPADAAALRRAEVAGFCTEGGGRTSHTAIVARAMGLPYVVGVGGLPHRDRGRQDDPADLPGARRSRAGAGATPGLDARSSRRDARRRADPPGRQRRAHGGDLSGRGAGGRGGRAVPD